MSRISHIPIRYDYEERWAKQALAQQARRRGILADQGAKRVYVNNMNRPALCAEIRAEDLITLRLCPF